MFPDVYTKNGTTSHTSHSGSDPGPRPILPDTLTVTANIDTHEHEISDTTTTLYHNYNNHRTGAGAGNSDSKRDQIKWIISLALIKFISALSVFWASDSIRAILSKTHPLLSDPNYFRSSGAFWYFSQALQVLALIQLSSGLILFFTQKPFINSNLSTKSINTQTVSISISNDFNTFRSNWKHLIIHSICSTFLLCLQISGLQLCGPFLFLVISQHYDFIIAGIFSALTIFKSGPRLRGTVLFGIAFAFILLFEHDQVLSLSSKHFHSKEPNGSSALSRNSIGILILLTFVPCQFLLKGVFKNFATDIGGQVKLNAISTLLSGIVLCFLVIIDLMAAADMVSISIPTIIFLSLFHFVLNKYGDIIGQRKMENSKLSRYGTSFNLGSALLLSMIWTTTEVPSVISLLSFAILFLGVLSLTSKEKATIIEGGSGSFVGYSADGLPLYNFFNVSSNEKKSTLPLKILMSGIFVVLKQIRKDYFSRKLFYLFVINFVLGFTELFVGFYSGSLSLRCDAYHILFDAVTLLIGVISAIISNLSPNRTYPFGFERLEVLCGFVNSGFFFLVACYTFVKGINRFLNPVDVDTIYVLPLAITSLLVNLYGIYSVKSKLESRKTSNSTNHTTITKDGIWIQVLLDTLSSTLVIISSIFIRNWNIVIMDSIASMLIGMLIVWSVYHFLFENGKILLLTVSTEIQKNIQQILLQVLSMEGVTGYKNHRFWTFARNIYFGSLNIQATREANEQILIKRITHLFSSIGFSHFTIQIEKEEFMLRRNQNHFENEIDENSNNDDNKNENGGDMMIQLLVSK